MQPTINLTVNINTPEAAEAVIRALMPPSISQETPASMPAAAPAISHTISIAPATPIQMPVAPPVAAPTIPATSMPTAAPQYALPQLTLAAQQLMDAGKQQQLIDLLASFQVSSMPQLTKEQYGTFATALRGLGARI